MDKETQYYIDKGLLKINKEESLNEATKLDTNEEILKECEPFVYHVTAKKHLKNILENGLTDFWFGNDVTLCGDLVYHNHPDYTDYVIIEINTKDLDSQLCDFQIDLGDGWSDNWGGTGIYNGTITRFHNLYWDETGDEISDEELEDITSNIKITFGESLNESKQDTINFKNWLDKIVSTKYPEMRQDNKEAYVKNWVDAFEDVRKSAKSPENDYYYWIKKNSLDDFAKFINQHTIKQNQKQRAKEGARQVYSDNNWKVYEITSYEASKKYGASTKWCISGSKRWTNDGNGEQFWNDYFTERGIKFYFFINKDGHKYALAVYPDNKYCEIYNDADVQISYIPDAPKIDEIKVQYTLVNERQNIYNAITSHKISDDLLAELIMDVTLEQDYSINHVIFCKNCKQFKDELDWLIPDTYIEFEAVDKNEISKEEYKELTGEDFNYPEVYNDYYRRNSYDWTGDWPELSNYSDIQSEIQAVSKEEFLNSDFWNQWEYYIFTFGEENYLYWTKNYNELLLDLLPYVFGTRYWDADTLEDFFMDVEKGGSLTNPCVVMMTNTLIDLIIKGEINNWQSLLKSWGCSDNYIKQLENAQKGDNYE